MSNNESIPTKTPCTSALPGSKKIYVLSSDENVRVPMREIALQNGDSFLAYDTSGPYSDPELKVDITEGIPDVRKQWIIDRSDTESHRMSVVHLRNVFSIACAPWLAQESRKLVGW